MKDVLVWATQNPGLFIVILIAICVAGGAIINFTYLIIKQLIRMVVIAVRGWPPYHLDADGDFRPTVAVVDDDD